MAEPKVLVFVCHSSPCGGTEQAGGMKLDYPPGVRLAKVMCSGRVDPQMVLDAFSFGMDGVLILGCHPGDCHYREGIVHLHRSHPVSLAALCLTTSGSWQVLTEVQ